jgi:hypothetical protein
MTAAQLGAGDAAFWVIRGPTTRASGSPARLRRLEPGVFRGQAIEVALEAGGPAEQKHAPLLAA